MIYITGDTHGLIDFEKLKKYFKNIYVSEKDYLIILGDAGFIWNNDTTALINYEMLGLTIIFIDGNHENFDLINEFPVVEYLGAKMHQISSHIFHILRGEIMTINGLTFLTIGGAVSIDKEVRLERYSYWIDEEITKEDIDNALLNLEKYNYRVDYILTHCIDSKTLKTVFHYRPDNSTDKLVEINEKVKFKHWYFGHYHEDIIYGIKRRCFYKDILEIKSYYTGKKNVKDNYYYQGGSGYLYSSKNRKTKLRPIDLPEWFYESYSYNYSFYNLKGVKDVAITKSPFDNHIDKDTRLYLSYSGIKDKTIECAPINEDDYDLNTWRVSLISFISGLEKYSPDLNLQKIKVQINLEYDYYANNENNYFNLPDCRPYLDVDTPILKSINYSVIIDGITLLNFKKLDLAIRYAKGLAKKKFKRYKKLNKYTYVDFYNSNNMIIIKNVSKEKKASYGFRFDN